MCPLGLYCLINVGYVLFFLLAAKEDKRCALEEIDDDEEKRKQTVDIPWILDLSHGKLSEKRKVELYNLDSDVIINEPSIS